MWKYKQKTIEEITKRFDKIMREENPSAGAINKLPETETTPLRSTVSHETAGEE